jgi:hypothetical protein
MGNLNGKTPFGSPRHIWVDNIKTDLQGTQWRTQIELNWLRTETGGMLLQKWL